MLFLAIVALATAECAQIVGVLLVFALMVGPAAAAQRLTSAILARASRLSAALALAEAWLGIALAYVHRLADEFLDHRAERWRLSAGDRIAQAPALRASSKA